MATIPMFQRHPNFPGVFEITDNRGIWDQQDFTIISRQSLPTDSIGIVNITLTNVVVGSMIHFEILSTGQAIHTEQATNAIFNISLPYYMAGNINNNIKIKIRNASGSPAYQPYETQLTLSNIPQSIFINQILDE